MSEEEKQALIEHAKSWIADAEAARDEIPFGFDEDTEMELSLIKIALSALTAQPDSWQQRAEAAEHALKDANICVEAAKQEIGDLEAKLAELEKQEHPQAVVRHYSGCKYPIIKVNSLEVVIAGDREDAEELADFINSIRPAPAVSLAPVSNCLSFFASVIKSGESWSATCQREMDAAWEALRNIEEAK